MTKQYQDKRVATEPRREEDRRDQCAVHQLLQEETKDHRILVCKKIDKKADIGQVKNVLYFVSILVTICCIVVAGGLAWLKQDITAIKSDAIGAAKETDAKIDAGFKETKETTANIHRRISENANMRIEVDRQQTKELEEIKGELKSFNWRLTAIENNKKK